MSGLIEGLPDAVALRCLAFVPYHLYPKLEILSHTWRDALRSCELFKARQDIGSSEELLCVCAYEPENLWQLYDHVNDLWITIPVLPSRIRHLSNFGVVSTAGKLFVLGGGSGAVDPLTGDHDGNFATNEVWSYDPVLRKWAQCAPMLVPRAMFACCVLNGKIVVAGGFISSRKSTARAEVYDPLIDQWLPIQDLPHTHNSACLGVVIGDKMHVMHKGLSTVQVLHTPLSDWHAEDYGWLHQGPMAVVKKELYVMSHGIIMKREGKNTKPVSSLSSEFKRKIGYGMTRLGKEIYVLGGVVGPDYGQIKPTSDVEALAVDHERPSWRRVAPMTRCYGTILGTTQLRI